MPPKRRRRANSKPRRRYSWSLLLDRSDPRLLWLDSGGREGLAYAQRLAEEARERRLAALENGIAPPVFGVPELAADEYLSPVHIHKQIKRARIQLFGKDLSDSAIYYQLRTPPQEGRCAEPGCPNGIPRHAPSHRRYCVEHTHVRARVRRHRRRATPPK
jgi:hypothetical protein